MLLLGCSLDPFSEGSHTIPCRSLLLSTSVLNDTYITSSILKTCPNLQVFALPIYITMNNHFDYGWIMGNLLDVVIMQCIVVVLIMDFYKTVLPEN